MECALIRVWLYSYVWFLFHCSPWLWALPLGSWLYSLRSLPFPWDIAHVCSWVDLLACFLHIGNWGPRGSFSFGTASVVQAGGTLSDTIISNTSWVFYESDWVHSMFQNHIHNYLSNRPLSTSGGAGCCGTMPLRSLQVLLSSWEACNVPSLIFLRS